jgi:autoinducer-2 kinase
VKKDFVMALDAGTGAARCFLVSLDGRTSYDSYQEWQYIYPPEAQPGGAEFDPNLFWNIFTTLIQKAIKESGVQGNRIVGISSTSQREGVIFLDKAGQELYAGPNIDMRSPSKPEIIEELYGNQIYESSGHWPFPMFAPYRLLWFKEHKPKVFQSIATVLLINDWILYKLSGEKASEPSNGNETLLMNLESFHWNEKLIENLGLPTNIFPKIIPSGTMLGSVTAGAAKATGLEKGTPVVTGGADTQCALLGTGSIKEGQVTTVLGTYAPSQMVVSRPIIDPKHRAWSGSHVVDGCWVVESTAMEAGQAFRWVRDVFYDGGGTDKYTLMDGEAMSSPIGAHGVQSFIGPRTPDYTHLKFDVRGGFYFNLPPSTGSARRADFSRSVLESIAYSIRANLERIVSITNLPIKSLSICGGLSKSKTLREALTNVLNVPVNIPEQKEGSAMGAALCASVGGSQIKSFQGAVEEMVHWECTIVPEKAKVSQYENLYNQWITVLPQVHGEEGLGELL